MTPFLTYILKASIALAVFYTIYELFLKRETFFQLNRIYLVSSLLLAFLIPALPVASPFKTAAPEPATDLSSLPSSASRAFGPADLLPFLYWAGVVLFLLRFGLQLARLRGVVRRNGIRRLGGAKIVPVNRCFPPFSFLDIIFLNEGLARDGNLSRILAHEEVHIRQQHTLDVLLMEIVLILQWFNPFVWPYKKALQATHEYLADSEVVAQGFSSVKYQLLMFEQHVGASLFEFGNNFKRSQIKRRIMMLSKAKSPNAAKLKLLLALPLVAALVLAFAEPRAAATAPKSALQEKSAAAAVEPTGQKVLKAQEEAKKLAAMEKDLRARLESTQDKATRDEIKKKLEIVLQKRKQVEDFLAGAAVPPAPPHPATPATPASAPPDPPAPPIPPPDELKAQYKALVEKEADVRAALEKTTDEAKKAELSKTLEMILHKQAKIKEMSKSAQVAVPQSIEELEKGLLKLQAKEKDIREKLKAPADPQQKAELEEMLKKVLQTQEAYKAGLEKAKAVKAEKIVK